MSEIATEDHLPGTSTDEQAERLLGRRDEDGPIGLLFHQPAELGFRCPVHNADPAVDPLETLHWSEYNATLWCELCDRDYPSTLCCPDLATAMSVFFHTVDEAIVRDREQR